jgi:hypothetical protein
MLSGASPIFFSKKGAKRALQLPVAELTAPDGGFFGEYMLY